MIRMGRIAADFRCTTEGQRSGNIMLFEVGSANECDVFRKSMERTRRWLDPHSYPLCVEPHPFLKRQPHQCRRATSSTSLYTDSVVKSPAIWAAAAAASSAFKSRNCAPVSKCAPQRRQAWDQAGAGQLPVTNQDKTGTSPARDNGVGPGYMSLIRAELSRRCAAGMSISTPIREESITEPRNTDGRTRWQDV